MTPGTKIMGSSQFALLQVANASNTSAASRCAVPQSAQASDAATAADAAGIGALKWLTTTSTYTPPLRLGTPSSPGNLDLLGMYENHIGFP